MNAPVLLVPPYPGVLDAVFAGNSTAMLGFVFGVAAVVGLVLLAAILAVSRWDDHDG